MALSRLSAAASPEELAQQSLDACPAVERLLRSRPRGLFTDIDGTISPITSSPDVAELLPEAANLLREALTAFDVVGVVSGRAVRDAFRLVGVPGLIYVGNHGLEELERNGAVIEHCEGAGQALDAEHRAAVVESVLSRLNDALSPSLPGLVIERKNLGGSIHVRATADPDAAEEIVLARARDLALPAGLRVTRGKRVVEVLPSTSIDKGTTLTRLVGRHALAGAVYLGDDRTDIDAFRALAALNQSERFCGVSIAVLHDEAPEGLAEAADIVLDSIEMVPFALRWLLLHAA